MTCMELTHTHKNFGVKRHIHSSSSKLQSAMEYLMTYGWAILIIAIVLVALFSLGVFNSANFAPKAPPGSCQVFRPNGPGTTFDLNLEGECNGELPQYVAQFNGAGFITAGNSLDLNAGTITLTAWENAAQVSGIYGIVNKDLSGNTGYMFGVRGGGVMYEMTTASGSVNVCCEDSQAPNPISPNTWYFIAVTYNGVSANSYLNSQPDGPGSTLSNAIGINTGSLYIGEYVPFFYNGLLANIQIYNTSLSQNDINTIYDEGIGGSPIDITNLVGWWPLNGNAQDYSGNQNNGASSGVTYTSAWTSGYTQP